jgi:hypothetical protein
MKQRIIIVSLIVLCVFNIGCVSSPQKTVQEKAKIEFSSIEDITEPRTVTNKDMVDLLEKAKKYSVPKVETTVLEVAADPVQEISTEPVQEESVDIDVQEESVDTIQEEPVDVVTQDQEYNDGTGLTQESGVNYYDGRTETYYSSNALYHQDTDQWTVDDEGFYRTDEGYYVVAASDMPQGTTFEGSKGTCIVLDSGCEEGVTDYYTNF